MNQTIQRVGAEDTPPPEADRLWEQAHPAELIFLIASGTAERQNFQAVSADFKLRYRIGLTDQDALQAAYGSADPVALLRASAGRVVAAFFAGQTLDRVLGENREEIADRLGVALQRDLDRSGAGIQVAAVVIEAIHPPAGAAEAYHNVQAAEIRANTSIEAERGRAKSTQANASQYATDVVAQAQAAAAETTSTAQSDLTRFTADHAAVSANSDAFLLERRLTAIGNGLAKSALTIVDHRIPPPEAPVLDLRPLSPTTARSAGTDRE
jgi:regulator of protease activity HflC (stomatin/prohibitin superfamily)